MSIDPDLITTIRVDQLPDGALSLTNLIAHVVGTDLKKATIQDLADLIAAHIGTTDAVGYYPLSVTDGQQLPSVPANHSFFLCGAGTYLNVNGYPDVVCTSELNVVMSLPDHWELSVGIPVIAEIGVQSVTGNGVDNTDPLNPVINVTIPDIPKSLEIKYISHNNAITKSDTAYYLVNNDEGLPVSNIDLDFDSGFVKDQVIQLTKIAQTVDADSVLNVRAIKTIGDPPEFYFGVGFNTLASGDIAFSIKAGDVVTMRFFSDWQVLVDIQRKNIDDFEIQITQTGTDAPVIIAGSIKGVSPTSTISTIRSADGVYYITSDQPDFSNVKDCFKGDLNRTFITTIASGGLNYYGYSFYAATDYIIELNTYDLSSGYVVPADDILQSAVLIKLPKKF